MNRLRTLHRHLRQKGLRRTLASLWRRYVYFHWELLWMQRDLDLPVPAQRLRACPPTLRQDIGLANLACCRRHFGKQLPALAEQLAAGHTGHLYLDPAGDAVAIIWASNGDYHDRHYYGCRFSVAPGEYFQFCGELARPWYGTQLSVDAQVNLWAAQRAKGLRRVVNVVAAHNRLALAMHVRMGYVEQGRVQHVHCLFGRWKWFRETRYPGSRLQALQRKYARPDDQSVGKCLASA